MFDPQSRRIQGFRCTHQLSPWLSDYGYAVFLPIAGDPKLSAQARSSSWRPERSTLAPHSFQLELLRYQISTELIPTERCALITADFAGAGGPGFVLDAPGREVAFESDGDARRIRFTSKANGGGVPENFATYYVVQFDTQWTSIETVPGEQNTVCVLHFPNQAASKCVARIATSFISFEQAAHNLSTELGHKTSDVLREEAAAQWNFYGRRIEIDGTEQQKRTFFSCLYRALLFPHTWHELDSAGTPHHFSPYDGKVHSGVLYADHGYWDVYRAWYPFMSILYPEKLAEILEAWVNAYREGGWLPQFPCPGYRACMTGSLIDAVFGDAAAKGIKGFDLATAYEGLKKHATQPGDPDKGYGRRGLEGYLKYGYVPTDTVEQSVAETVDAAYGDFCIAQVAEALGYAGDARMFRERSRNWRHLFDESTRFLRAKQEDGSWLEPFDEFQWGSPYVEGSAWQHRWDVPHDVDALIAQMGGKVNAVATLEKMLTLQPIFHTGIYGAEIHEMSEMAAVDFGQYAHSNQPVHHVLYAFAVAGRSDRTEYWVRRVLNELYSPNDFPGDEDTGSMSAWFLLSSMGFYPLCPGKPEYVLGSPLFNKVTLHLANGKILEIEAAGQSEDAVYVANVSVDGGQHRSVYLSHETILRGGRVVFTMRNQPAGS